MSRTPASFTEADLKRALSAASKAGFTVGAIEISRDGTIRLEPASADLRDGKPSTGNPSLDLKPRGYL